MKLNELNCLKFFLDKLDQSFSISGCNDFELINNPENLDLVRNAVLWNCKNNKTEFEKEWKSYIQYEQKDLFGGVIYTKILTQDFFIFSFLREKLKSSIILES